MGRRGDHEVLRKTDSQCYFKSKYFMGVGGRGVYMEEIGKGSGYLESGDLAFRDEYIEMSGINALIFNGNNLISRWYITTLCTK